MRFETRYTYTFVKRFLPPGCQRVLEVGCGSGDLAAVLSNDGYSVVAIDMDKESIDAAQQLGVDARVATWPESTDGRFDAVLFTRSLHHIHPLRESIKHLTATLTQTGRVIIEDFAYESADEKTLRWFSTVFRQLKNMPALAINQDVWEKVLSKAETLEAWRENHEKELHTAGEMNGELQKVFGRVVRENAAYFFRYAANALPATEGRGAFLQTLATEEETLFRSNSIVALGRRFVAAAGG